MLGKAKRKKEREVDSSAYERTEVLNKSLRNRNQRFTAASVLIGRKYRLVCLCVVASYDNCDPTINIFINLTIVTFLEIDLISHS